MAKSEKGQEAPSEFMLEFDGSTTYIEIPSNNELDLVNNFTLEAWVKPKWLSGVQRIFSKAGAYGFGLIGNQIRFTTYDKQDYDTTQAKLSVDTWVHLAVSFSPDNQADFYVNGVMVQALPGTQSANKSSAPCMIGSQESGGGEYFAGQIADVRIWNVARREEISANPGRRLEGNEPGLVGYWLLNEGSGTSAQDKTSSANHGTIAGSVNWVSSDLPLAPSESSLPTTSTKEPVGLGEPATAPPNVSPSPSPLATEQFIPIEEPGELSEPATAPPNVTPTPPEPSVESSPPVTPPPVIAQPIPPATLQGRQLVLSLGENHQGITAGGGALKLRSRFTIEAWVYPATNAVKQVIYSEGETLFYLEGGELKFQTHTAEIALTSVGAEITAGNWYHVAVARGGRRPGKTKLYINGSQNDNQAAIGTVLTVGSTCLGAQFDVADSRFAGKLLEVRVWRYARSQAEIQANMTYFLTGRELGLVRCWALNEGFGSAIGDKTTNRSGGTVIDDVTWEELDIPIKTNLSAQERLTRSTGLEDYGYWFKEMAKEQKTEPVPHFRRGRIWA